MGTPTPPSPTCFPVARSNVSHPISHPVSHPDPGDFPLHTGGDAWGAEARTRPQVKVSPQTALPRHPQQEGLMGPPLYTYMPGCQAPKPHLSQGTPSALALGLCSGAGGWEERESRKMAASHAPRLQRSHLQSLLRQLGQAHADRGRDGHEFPLSRPQAHAPTARTLSGSSPSDSTGPAPRVSSLGCPSQHGAPRAGRGTSSWLQFGVQQPLPLHALWTLSASLWRKIETSLRGQYSLSKSRS